ncbi:zinc finger protein 511-like isoform X2 [Dendronephthya gigantea]|uniref:zinc finger protein 511-like isoform X2 n=1 Tax=Dendronephthya gigantea TaxID=151771 RepID=UPI00106AC88A|nr:zinc finger protein 511-like isoform X2 [Dendronephthya gigantea]
MMDVQTNNSVAGGFPWSFSPCKRMYPPGHAFFEDGDIFCSVLSKQIVLPDDPVDLEHREEIVCDLIGCHQIFHNVDSYEAHYDSYHRNICLECRRTFPSNFLLELHILENHDVLFKLMSNAKYTHRCLVENCPDKFSDDAERKEHLVKVHKYPANFRFNRPSRKQRKIAKDTSDDMEITNIMADADGGTTRKSSQTSDMEIADEHVVEKKRIPKGICFGRGSSVAFQRKGQHRRGRK